MIHESLIQEPPTMFAYSLEWFKQCSPLSKGQRSLKLGNEEYVSLMVARLMELCLLDIVNEMNDIHKIIHCSKFYEFHLFEMVDIQ